MPTNYNPDTDALETMQERFAREAEVDERIMCGEHEKAAKAEHTPEPWEWSKHKFNSPPFEGTLEQECGIYPPLGESCPVAIASGEANARRIVACVNACAGIPTEALEDGSARAERDDIASAIKQRDELLAEFNAYKEGSEEAFGTVVAQKQAAEARLQTMQSTIALQQGVICDLREQRDDLLAALELRGWMNAHGEDIGTIAAIKA